VSSESEDEFLAYYRERNEAEKPEGASEEGLFERIVICDGGSGAYTVPRPD
jgi:hypothetical protein